MSGPQVLEIERLGSERVTATAALPNDDTYDRRLAFNVQATLQRDALVVFPEIADAGVKLVAWDMSSGQILGRSAATLPAGSYPIGVAP
jgi:hypothetical protein